MGRFVWPITLLPRANRARIPQVLQRRVLSSRVVGCMRTVAMRHQGLLAAAGLILLAGLSGCRSSCSSRSGLFSRSQNPCMPVSNSVQPCSNSGGGGFFSLGHKKKKHQDPSGEVVVLPGTMPLYSGMSGSPVYPSGVPVPLTTPGSTPNELPPPSIAPPGVPETPSPFANPIPAAQTGNVLPTPSGPISVLPMGKR